MTTIVIKRCGIIHMVFRAYALNCMTTVAASSAEKETGGPCNLLEKMSRPWSRPQPATVVTVTYCQRDGDL